MKNIILSILFITSFFFGYAQLKPSEVLLKTGEKIICQGKISGEYFKYKLHSKSKLKKLHFSNIDFVKIRFSKDNIKTYRYFKIKNTNKTVIVEDIITGERASLYAVVVIRNNPVAGGGSFPMTIVSYYVKKKSTQEVTYFGVHDPFFNNLKEKILNFFKDCDSLVEKIKNKEFRIRSDIGKMVKFYNIECKEN